MRFALLQTFVGCLMSILAIEAQGATMKSQRTKPIELGSHKQLLFDELFLAKSKGITLRMNRPVQELDPVLVADKPWENLGIGAYNTVMLEKGRLRMWYDATARDNKRRLRRLLCYAESKDGKHWDKPQLGLIAFNGSKKNNIVAPPGSEASQQGGTVFRDDRAPASERYKLWTKYQASKEDNKNGIGTGLWAMISPDGLRWKLLREGYPLGRGNAADSQNVCFWDKDVGKYVGFVRMKTRRTEQRQRDCYVGLMTSDDFRNWTWAKEVFRADERIPAPAGVKLNPPPFVDLYTPGGMKVPGIPNAYILLPTPYYHWSEGWKDAFPSNIDVGFATSRDRVNWWRPPEFEPFLRLGPDGSASSGMIFSNPWPIVRGDEIWIYYAGIGRDHRQTHREWGRSPSRSGIFRARIRLDGFVSADAGYKGGEFTTPLVTFTGRRLELNIDGSAGGWLQVEILSPKNKPVPGYRLDRCDTIRGNSVKKAVTWQGKSDVSKLTGKPIRLRFVMRSIKLFAFQFVK